MGLWQGLPIVERNVYANPPALQVKPCIVLILSRRRLLPGSAFKLNTNQACCHVGRLCEAHGRAPSLQLGIAQQGIPDKATLLCEVQKGANRAKWFPATTA